MWQHGYFFCCLRLYLFVCTSGRNFCNLGFCGVFRWLGTLSNLSFSKEGQGFCLGLACFWITKREMKPQPMVALRLHLVRLVLTALATCSPCLGEDYVRRETRVSHLVRILNHLKRKQILYHWKQRRKIFRLCQRLML